MIVNLEALSGELKLRWYNSTYIIPYYAMAPIVTCWETARIFSRLKSHGQFDSWLIWWYFTMYEKHNESLLASIRGCLPHHCIRLGPHATGWRTLLIHHTNTTRLFFDDATPIVTFKHSSGPYNNLLIILNNSPSYHLFLFHVLLELNIHNVTSYLSVMALLLV